MTVTATVTSAAAEMARAVPATCRREIMSAPLSQDSNAVNTSSVPVRRLALFDIDGTLIHTARAGVRGMNAAFHDLHGHEDALAGMTFAGRTDRAIVFEAFA